MSRSRRIPPEALESAAAMMRAIGHPLRLQILEILEAAGEANVSAICARTGAAQPLVSQQLARLRAAGVLARERSGNQVFYRVARSEVLGVLECIRRMRRTKRRPRDRPVSGGSGRPRRRMAP